jgi:hypothetical protein
VEGEQESSGLDGWYRLVGEVVVTAAYLESAVGTLAYALDHGAVDRFYAKTLGELRTLCEKHIEAHSDAGIAAELRKILVRVGRLADQRNDLIHGWWRFGTDGKDAIRGRATSKAPSLYISKSTLGELRAFLADLNETRDHVLQLAQVIADAHI